MISVLFVHSTPSFGGASKSLSELGRFLSKSARLSVITPNGNVVPFFRKSRFEVYTTNVSQFNNTEYGYYRGLRWIVLLRECVYLPFSFYKIYNLSKNNHFDLVHLNEVTLLPWAWFFKKLNLPVVVHVRSVYKPFSNTFRDRFFLRLFENYVDHVIAIDETVKASLPSNIPVSVIHNGLYFESSYPEARCFDAKPKSELNVCIVGSLLRLKGLYEFVEASKILLDKGLNIKFHVVGKNPRKNGLVSSIYKKLGLSDDVENDLRRFIVQNSLSESVIFHGLIEDISAFYSNMDVVCFPSYYNAPGRPVFEAAYYGIPSIVAVDRSTADTIVHNETGLVIEKPSSELLSEQLERLYHDRSLLAKLGAGARKLAENYYSLEKNASSVKKIYEKVLLNKVV